MQEEQHLTVDQCDELAKALREDAACLPHGSERDNLLQLAEGYQLLADMKRMVLCNAPMMSAVVLVFGRRDHGSLHTTR